MFSNAVADEQVFNRKNTVKHYRNFTVYHEFVNMDGSCEAITYDESLPAFPRYTASGVPDMPQYAPSPEHLSLSPAFSNGWLAFRGGFMTLRSAKRVSDRSVDDSMLHRQTAARLLQFGGRTPVRPQGTKGDRAMSLPCSRSNLSLLICTAVVLATGHSSADEPKPTVSLILTKASAERSGPDTKPPDTLFRCEVSLDNQMGSDLVVRSNFNSAFDGLELVVTTVEGKTLAQQSHAVHQSPFAEPRDFKLKKGVTTATIGFPIQDFPADAKVVKVRVVGTLPGSGYQRVLSTETLEVKIK
ncbi:MAG: hypothetical protein WCJ09_13800 [Planctomycetota bacterium]